MPGNPGADAAGADSSGLDAAVVAEQIRLLLERRADLPVNLLNAAIVSATLWPLYPAWIGIGWLSLFTIVILARSLIRRRYRIAAPGVEGARRWGRIFAWNAYATACLWGLTGSVILVTSNGVYHIFIVFVLGGMLAGSIVSNAAYKPAMFAMILPAILPAIVVLITRHDIVQIEMGVMLALFAAVLIIAGRNINRSVVENFRLRIAQDFLSVKLRASEAAMAEAQALANVGSWEHDLETDSYVWSAETFRIFHTDPATPRPGFEIILARVHPDDRAMVEKDYAKVAATGTGSGIDHRIVMDDGAIRFVHEIVRTTYDAQGRPLRVYGTVQDITERRGSEEKLQFANVLLKAETEASPDGILVVDANRAILSFNQRFAEIWKIPVADLEARDDQKVLAQVTSSVKDSQQFKARIEYLYAHRGEDSREEYETTDGRFIDRYTVTLTALGEEYLGRVWFFRDVTRDKQEAAQALRMARFDGLTGLANRSVFVEALERAVVAAKRGVKGFAVIYLDLDHFKDVNDTLGHPVGDALLKDVADRLRLNARESDTVARFGGDEFAVVVTGIGEPADAAIVADKLIDALCKPYSIQGNEIYSGASIGIDIYGPESADAETLLSHADVALYRAKSEGRGGYRFFTDEMDQTVRTRVALGTELHAALDGGQLFLLYQPQVAVASGRITGVEALLRWRHPRRGILTPELFIPVAERIGIMVKLGHWVLLQACRQAKTWFDAGGEPIRTSVNLSALQFQSPLALETDIAAILAETGLPPRLLELELTETILMNASREHSDLVPRFHRVGVTIAIDDFGTGYSSLEYLRRFPVDRIKIAQVFVLHLETIRGDVAIVKAIIGLARELGIKVIAEGVETREQLELLKGWGCAEAQGFYFARPLAAEDVTNLLSQGRLLEPQNRLAPYPAT